MAPSGSFVISFNDVCKMLEVCHTVGLIFNSDKFQFGQDVVEFAGLEIMNDGVRPCKKFLDAIRAFQTQTNITKVRSFFGMVNQVNYPFLMSETMVLTLVTPQHAISMVTIIAGTVRKGQGDHSASSGERGETFRGGATDLPSHGFLQVRVRILLVAEVVRL